MRAQEGMVRAASLSALGDVCKQLKFSLGPVIHEVCQLFHFPLCFWSVKFLYTVFLNVVLAYTRRQMLSVICTWVFTPVCSCRYFVCCTMQ